QRFVVSSISTRSKQFEYYRKCWDLIRVSLVVQRFSGEIEVQSKPGEGSRFIISLVVETLE
ncbi:MAG: hypothetical protein AB2669_17435, partial [Candidatus Thiodiazotropha endolucinida]